MGETDGLKRYLEAGMALTQVTRARAEELVRELVKTGEFESSRAQDWVEDLVKVSRERSETLVSTIRGEVSHQLKEMGFTNVDDLARKVEDVLQRSSDVARKATRRPGGKGKKSDKKGAGGKAPAKKAAKKAAASKAPAKKATAKKAAAKKTTAKKASG